MKGYYGAIIATISFIIPSIIIMTIINKILDKFKDNQKVEKTLKYIRVIAFANILISCISIIERAFIINNNMNFKVIVFVILMSILLKKVKISSIFGIFFAGIIGILFKFCE